MTILFFDSMFPKGHRIVNSKFLSIFQKMNAKVYICSNDVWFEENDNCCVIKRKWRNPGSGKIKPRFKIIINFIKMLRILNEIKPDILYVASYDIVVMWLFSPLLRKYRDKVYLQEHNNIDQLDNPIKLRLYSTFCNVFQHLVFEEFIKDRLISLKVNEKLIFVVPHPVPNPIKDIEFSRLEPLVVGLSNSNSETIVNDIIREQKSNHILNDTHYQFVLKASTVQYSDDALVVLNGWISREKYSYYCLHSEYFILPFPKKGYSYRVSNVFMEAISNNKKILSSRFPLAEYYEKRYPGICSIFDSIDVVPHILREDRNSIYYVARKQFMFDHSDEAILKAFISAFKLVIK